MPKMDSNPGRLEVPNLARLRQSARFFDFDEDALVQAAAK